MPLHSRAGPKPLRDARNYQEKARKFGYRGEREIFHSMEAELLKLRPNVKDRLNYLEVFMAVMAMLDYKQSVLKDLF